MQGTFVVIDRVQHGSLHRGIKNEKESAQVCGPVLMQQQHARVHTPLTTANVCDYVTHLLHWHDASYLILAYQSTA